MNTLTGKPLQKTSVFLTLCIFMIAANPVAARTQKAPKAQTVTVDLVTITKIKCHKSAGGLDGAAIAGFAALGATVAGLATGLVAGSTVMGTGGAGAIGVVAVSKVAIAKAAVSGAGAAVGAAKFLDSKFSGQDDLIVWVDGKKVLPTSGKFQAMNAGQEITPNVTASIKGTGIISLFEYDSGSDNDPLGNLIVQGGSDVTVQDAIVLAPREEDGSVYFVSYKVEKGKGVEADVVMTTLCGTVDSGCGINQPDLDRDKDVSDLVPCPERFREAGLVKYPQIWPAADVYLRRCTRVDPVMGVAIGKPAMQSSSRLGNNAMSAVDGDKDGNYANNSVSHTEDSVNPWWQVDLGQDYQINTITIWNRTDCCAERLQNLVVLLATEKDKTWHEYGSIRSANPYGPRNGIRVDDVARHIRIEMRGTGILSMAEVEVIGIPASQIPQLTKPQNVIDPAKLVGSGWTYSIGGNEYQFEFGQYDIEKFSNGWWKGISWVSIANKQLYLRNRQTGQEMKLTFDSADNPTSFTGVDWDGKTPVSGRRR